MKTIRTKLFIAMITMTFTFGLNAQESQPEPIFMNVMLTPNPAKITEFEAGIKSHNKKFHASGANAVRVYWISSGKNAGKYIWSMGPTAWTAFDGANNPDEAHSNDWNTNVAPYAEATTETNYWKGDAAHSNFTNDFELKNLAVFYLDMKRFQNQKFMTVLDKVTKVYKTKDANEQWGVYWNQMPNTDGQDMVWINFFDSMSWMGEDDKFPQWYEEVHGEGSFTGFLKDFEASTKGDWQELWMFRQDLSGLSGEVVVTSGQ
ncbi:hypothetical protein MTsPCn9_02570 [Croceitalea sp. MTPC9]|uniref:hypothetical protein n=1 Tax=unclassified Croceitalea TaxID=2632280 RepID=UPI002B3F1BF1|nr:hypothetical protein MTsPCn6_06140 [Croceitalea sp. MTPC6]GMN15321.1 hypothetical protein MTsPCn9_02570 [Croceitalea sp. MTPC9]